ncbi:MAG: hypothetical protein KIT46_01705 [Anaerolineales bacterium]|nr:hypothetical protein [Anaerolineales bacterium]MCW5854739.1 hypothetical protein [Anaerolineales bacterium]
MKLNAKLLGFLALVALALWLRISQYPHLSLSVSNYDSDRYGEAGQLGFPSLRFFTSIQQPTIAWAYQALEPDSGYQITNISSPGDQLHPPLVWQPGFERITTLQAMVATLAWVALAWAVFRSIETPPLQYLAAGLVLLFGLSPQVVEWDYVMLSEPLAISLLVALLAVSIELMRTLGAAKPAGRGKRLALGALWLLITVLWVFARDTNNYMLPAFVAALIAMRFWQPDRSQLPTAALAGLGLALVLLFVTASSLAQQSGRWINPFFNNLLDRVLPVAEHRAFFEARGLPVSEELLAEVGGNLTELSLFNLSDLVRWTEQNGTQSYMAFLASHPQWALQEFVEDTQHAFTENAQPFFRRDTEVTPAFLVYLGDLLHPTDSLIVWLVVLQLGVLLWLAVKRGNRTRIGLALLFWLFFLGSVGTLFVSIHGDAAGIVRHALSSVLLFRLLLWLLPGYILDALAESRANKNA